MFKPKPFYTSHINIYRVSLSAIVLTLVLVGHALALSAKVTNENKQIINMANVCLQEGFGKKCADRIFVSWRGTTLELKLRLIRKMTSLGKNKSERRFLVTLRNGKSLSVGISIGMLYYLTGESQFGPVTVQITSLLEVVFSD